MTDSLLKYREQHKHRLNYMPWLYWTLKPKHRAWAEEWQKEYQAYLMDMETVEIGVIIVLLRQIVVCMDRLRLVMRLQLTTTVF